MLPARRVHRLSSAANTLPNLRTDVLNLHRCLHPPKPFSARSDETTKTEWLTRRNLTVPTAPRTAHRIARRRRHGPRGQPAADRAGRRGGAAWRHRVGRHLPTRPHRRRAAAAGAAGPAAVLRAAAGAGRAAGGGSEGGGRRKGWAEFAGSVARWLEYAVRDALKTVDEVVTVWAGGFTWPGANAARAPHVSRGQFQTQMQLAAIATVAN